MHLATMATSVIISLLGPPAGSEGPRSERVELGPPPSPTQAERLMSRGAEVGLIAGGVGLAAGGAALFVESDFRLVSAGAAMLALGPGLLAGGVTALSMDERRLARAQGHPRAHRLGRGGLGAAGAALAVSGASTMIFGGVMLGRTTLSTSNPEFTAHTRRPARAMLIAGAAGVTAGLALAAFDLGLVRVREGRPQGEVAVQLDFSDTHAGLRLSGRF